MSHDVMEHSKSESQPDPVQVSVIHSLLVAIMDECEINLSRTALSPLIYEGKDYCIGLLDVKARTIVQSRGSVPTFMSDLGVPVADALELYGEEGIHEGDVFMMNYGNICGQHLNNMVLYAPVHDRGTLIGFVATRAHWTDVGGMTPGSVSTNAREIFQEGIQFRTVKIYKRGTRCPEIYRMLRHNTRYPDIVTGDMEAQIAAVELGRRRYAEMIEKYGWDTLSFCIDDLWNRSEALARERIRAIPDGSYSAEAFLDDDGIDPDVTIPLKVTVRIEGDTFTLDYSEFPPQTLGPMNSSGNVATSVARVAFKSAIVPEGPATEGTFAPVNVIIPDGTILSARDNAPLGLWTVSIKTVVDMIYLALSQVLPDAVPAAHHGSMGVYSFSGHDPETGRDYSTADTVLGGWGARPDADGFSPLKTVTHGDTKQIAAEVEEVLFPITIESHEWLPDSAGPGEFRGGLGLKKVYRLPIGARFVGAFERAKCPPWGLFGGGDAQPGRIMIKQPDESEWHPFLKVTNHEIKPGGLVALYSGGGGGRGPAWKRPVERVLEDVRLGYVTPQGAARDYGVQIDATTMQPDLRETDRLRTAMRENFAP
ncbi:MAG: hydantoinase B/oxoprolinase family protein [Pelagimonas sp.]|uniref:hydantoinase B/oxoprolinase family protein n=1 Tax=Pelagimonas sp. TaxID=2073170 RepID=UPI003D6C372E